MTRPIKKCVDCDAPFQTSATGKTVRCQSCRNKRNRNRGATSSRDGISARDHEYVSARFACKTCGKSFSRGDARKHRTETGHSF
jgi:hypothetical protein